MNMLFILKYKLCWNRYMCCLFVSVVVGLMVNVSFGVCINIYKLIYKIVCMLNGFFVFYINNKCLI